MAVEEFTDEVQELFIRFLISDSELFIRVAPVTRSTYFKEKFQKVIKLIRTHSDQYKTIPTPEIIKAQTGFSIEKLDDITIQHKEWFIDTFERFAKHQALKRAILKSADHLEDGNYDMIEALVKEAVLVSLNRDLGVDFFENPKKTLMELKEANGSISSGLLTLDQKLFGGFSKGELIIYAAPPGGGKSVALQNEALYFIKQGLNVVFITCELSERLTAKRIISMATDIPSPNIFASLDKIDLDLGFLSKSTGRLQIKYMNPGKTTANSIKAYLKEYEIQKGVRPDVLIVDYLDLMTPINKRIDPANLFIKDKYVSEELRALANDLQMLTLTASQFNRSSINEMEFDQSMIAGGLSKINTADCVIGIYNTLSMRDRREIQFQLLKTRNSSGVGQKIVLRYDIDTLKISDPTTDGEKTEKKSILETIKANRTRVMAPKSPEDPALKGLDETNIQADRLRALMSKVRG